MHAPLRVLVGSLGPGVLPDAGVAEPPRGTVLLDLGPDHPSRAGLLELRLWTDDGVITSAEVVVGAMHRGAEKLFEVRDYRQILMLADRHDWQAPFSGELVVALTCEQMLGLEVPERAVWLRTLLAEHTRVLSHLGFLGHVPYVLGQLAPGQFAPGQFALGRAGGVAEVREQLRHSTYVLTGNRIHPMANRLGGLAVDADPVWLDAEDTVMDAVDRVRGDLAALVDSDAFTSLTAGVAVLEAPTIAQYGVSGPAARASGVPLDLRRRDPYLAYGALADLLGDPPDLTDLLGDPPDVAGDARSRFRALLHDVEVSSALVRACTERLRSLRGPVSVKLPKIVKLGEGELYRAVEAPLGIAGVHLVSRGEKTPWRLKLRTPSFATVSALESLLRGLPVAQLDVTLASMGYVVGDVDR